MHGNIHNEESLSNHKPWEKHKCVKKGMRKARFSIHHINCVKKNHKQQQHGRSKQVIFAIYLPHGTSVPTIVGRIMPLRISRNHDFCFPSIFALFLLSNCHVQDLMQAMSVAY
jgi:hypothetical protein